MKPAMSVIGLTLHGAANPGLNPSLLLLVNQNEPWDPKEWRGREQPMRSDPLRRGAHLANHGRHEGTPRFDRSEHETTEPLDPIVGWSIVVLISLALWWGVWAIISSLL